MKTHNYKYSTGLLNELIDFSLFKEEKNILVQIFCGQSEVIFETIIHDVLENIPHAICIGTTTDGEICEDTVTLLQTIISISIFESTNLQIAYEKYADEKDSFPCGYDLASRLVTKNTKLLILFTDGTNINAEEFLKGIESYDSSVVICGGMAGDNGQFIKTYISAQNTILSQGAVGVSLNSDILQIATDYKFDWQAIGLEHTIEEVEGNRIYKIDGMKPVDFYGKYLGSNVSQTEFPLIVQSKGLPKARAVIAKHEDGSLSCGGNLQKGDKVKIGFGDAKSLIKSPIEVLKNLQKVNAQTFFIYSCMARRRYLPDLINLQAEPFSHIAPTSGFFTYSEFFHQDGYNELLNQTLTVVALSEKSTKKKIETYEEEHLSAKEKSYAKTIESLTNLIQQSALDYDEQSIKLKNQMNYSKNVLMGHKQFLRYTVHEMNTPLSVIMNNIELHEMEFSKSVYFENIEVAVKSIFSLYDDLSYLVKKDQIVYLKQKINLADYIRSRVDFFAQVADKAKSNFILTVDSDDMYIYFNETKLQRIIDNNLTNAIKYTFENKDILVSLKQDKENYNFVISSHSRKIQKPELIFEEYYREETRQDGFGLGLNLVKKICNEENVQINLESNENLTSFTYKFPMDVR
ncbi:FIST N-terminal domain-containing protein [Sulfurospirillum arcachonense]|uniref:FIST N-terminal domain-containing protein n=1 Tax=Sulfurospirillum arcachonense TaxID=57666 RepID=UPI0004681906|nr:FIST N-terminal domain-containing protein [Sulfurospirillum arcachonense]